MDARRDARVKPDDATLQKALTDEEKKIVGMERRVAENNAKAKVIEDRIDEINKPPLRKYSFRLVDPKSE